MIQLSNSYREQLDDQFYELRKPDEIHSPKLLAINYRLADFLGLPVNDLTEEQLAAIFSGKDLPADMQPIALAYAGHQFGNFVPQLGDGRAVMLGEAEAADGRAYDLQLKGSGQTRFSRAGDGKSALGPVIREYVVSEAMFHLGIPTSRALAAIATSETVYRQRPEPGGIFTRVASGHVRIGTFEYFASRQQLEPLTRLANYCIDRFYPDARQADNPYLAFFESVARGIMDLVAKWQGVGFIHGVMNTDNMNIAAETIDYGPCAFMDNYRSDKVFSSIDHHGRYAYNQQPSIAQWNLSILASCLVPLVDKNHQLAISQLQETMNGLQEYFENAWLKVFRPKFGLFDEQDGDRELIEQFLTDLELQQKDFTLAFRELITDQPEQHRARLKTQSQSMVEAQELMRQNNPWLIPRNHQVEKAIQLAYQDNFSYFDRLVEAYQQPYEENEVYADLALPPEPSEEVRQTFCGT